MRKSRYSPRNQVFLALLKACRLSNGHRQKDVAARLGRDQALVSKVESGERRLDIIELYDWLLIIGVDFTAFMTELAQRIRESDGVGASVFLSTVSSNRATELIKASLPGGRPSQRAGKRKR